MERNRENERDGERGRDRDRDRDTHGDRRRGIIIFFLHDTPWT